MSYIIIQHDYLCRFEEIDAMIDEENKTLKTFSTEEDARLFLHHCGVEGFENGFPHQIRVGQLH
jgi:hypothetical protein